MARLYSRLESSLIFEAMAFPVYYILQQMNVKVKPVLPKGGSMMGL